MTFTSSQITEVGAVLTALASIAGLGRLLVATVAKAEAQKAIAADKQAEKDAADKQAAKLRAELDRLADENESLKDRVHHAEIALAELRAVAAPLATAMRDLQNLLLERR